MSEDFIVNTAHTISTYRPLQGSVAFVRAAAAMASFRACLHARHPSLPAGSTWRERGEDQLHPGEGSA